MIRIAIQEGGSSNPQLNSQLKSVIDQAVKSNMPLTTVNNQIKKFNANDAQMKKYFLELKSQNKIFLICEFYTDNLAQAKMNINTVMRKSGNTSFADVRHMFDEIGYVSAKKADGIFANESEFEEKVMEDGIECDVQEVEDIDFASKSASFICPPMELERVRRSLISAGYVVDIAEHIFAPKHTQRLAESEMSAFEKLKDRLSLLDGYENVFDNVHQSELE